MFTFVPLQRLFVVKIAPTTGANISADVVTIASTANTVDASKVTLESLVPYGRFPLVIPFSCFYRSCRWLNPIHRITGRGLGYIFKRKRQVNTPVWEFASAVSFQIEIDCRGCN